MIPEKVESVARFLRERLRDCGAEVPDQRDMERVVEVLCEQPWVVLAVGQPSDAWSSMDPDDPLGDLARRLAEKPEHLRRRPDGSLIMVKYDDPTCCSPRAPRVIPRHAD